MSAAITSIEQLLVKQISWHEAVPGCVELFAYLDGELCKLTMNDFPDEPLYTLRWRESSLDLDDRPPSWSFAK